MLFNEQCCSLLFQQCCWTNNVVHYCFNNVVERTILFTIVSTMFLNEQCCSLLFQRCCQCCSLLFQQCCSALMKQQRDCSRLLNQDMIGFTIDFKTVNTYSSSTCLTICVTLDIVSCNLSHNNWICCIAVERELSVCMQLTLNTVIFLFLSYRWRTRLCTYGVRFKPGSHELRPSFQLVLSLW